MLPLQGAGNFLLDGKKSPKNVFVVRVSHASANDHVHVTVADGRASCAPLNVDPIWKKKRKKLFSFAGLTALASCLCFYKKLDTSRAQAQNEGSGAQGCARPQPAART